MKSTFDPTIFNFDKSMYIDNVWETNAQPNNALIGTYVIRQIDDWWLIKEIIMKNGDPSEVVIYSGRIPDNEWGFQLLKNMDLILPVIQRENKIDFLTKN